MEKIKQSIIEYFKGVRAEWGKVVWPSKQQVTVYFIWVLVICIVFVLLILLLDLGFDALFGIFTKNAIR